MKKVTECVGFNDIQGSNFLLLVGSLEGPNQLCSLESMQPKKNKNKKLIRSMHILKLAINKEQ